MKIKHVYGNVLRLDIPLTVKIITSEGGHTHETEEPFYPDTSKSVLVELANKYNITKYTYEATMNGNVAHIEDHGDIKVGVYKVTVKCYDEYGNPYRYMARDIIDVVDATADAGIEAGVEFNAETYTLEGAVFVSYGGQVQADWTEADINSKAYIKNKPTNLVEDESYVHTDNNYTDEEKEKLADLENYDDSGIRQEIGGKVDKVNGKGLSTNDYTDEDKQKVNSALQSETDPTVPQWAKQSTKPSYTPQEVGALPADTPLFDGDYNSLTNKPDLSGYITISVNNLVNYYLKSDTYTKDEVQQIVSAIKQFSYLLVDTLPEASAETMHCIYLVPSADPQAQNTKDEYITILRSTELRKFYDWEQIGSTAIDLSGYYTSAETDSAISAALNAALANYTTTNDLTTLLAAKANADEMSVVDGTGTDADKTTITLKTGTSATVLKSHQSLAGKQDLIDSTHKLSADLVDDTSTTNKFVTASDKTTWDNKYTKPQTGIPASDIEAGVIPVIPSNTSYFSNYSGVGIVPEDGIRAETVTNAATMSINPDVLTLIDGTVGTATITLQVPNDSLAHVWDIMLTTDSTVNITLAMSNSATIKVPSGFAIGASADCEISVIGKGTKYYLRYGEFA